MPARGNDQKIVGKSGITSILLSIKIMIHDQHGHYNSFSFACSHFEGDPEGRPSGSVNKKSQQWNELGEKFTGNYSDQVIKYLDDLWESDRDKFFEAYKSMLNYFKPKLAASTMDIDATIEGLSTPSWFGKPFSGEVENE